MKTVWKTEVERIATVFGMLPESQDFKECLVTWVSVSFRCWAKENIGERYFATHLRLDNYFHHRYLKWTQNNRFSYPMRYCHLLETIEWQNEFRNSSQKQYFDRDILISRSLCFARATVCFFEVRFFGSFG